MIMMMISLVSGSEKEEEGGRSAHKLPKGLSDQPDPTPAENENENGNGAAIGTGSGLEGLLMLLLLLWLSMKNVQRTERNSRS